MTMAENSSMTGRTLSFDELTGVEVEGKLYTLRFRFSLRLTGQPELHRERSASVDLRCCDLRLIHVSMDP